MFLLRFLKCRRRELEDFIQYNQWTRSLIGRWLEWRARRMPRGTDQERARVVERLCAAARMAEPSPPWSSSPPPDLEAFRDLPLGPAEAHLVELQRQILLETERIDESRLDWFEFFRKPLNQSITTGIILKPYLGPREKGVVYIALQYNWAKLLRQADAREFARRYSLIIGSGSGPLDLYHSIFARAYPEPFFSLVSNPEEMTEIPRVSNKIMVLPMNGSCWVNPDLFPYPPRSSRPFDLVMVASFNKVKRHFSLFKALRQLPRSLRVLLVGVNDGGRTADHLRAEARDFGVADRFELRTSLPYPEAAAAFGEARASLILSRREGNCRVVTESMFADTPVGLLQGARLGPRIHINDQTGRFLDERRLARDLARFLEESETYRPRAWALEHISCFRATTRLNGLLKDYSLAQGGLWTRDIVPFQRSPNSRYVRPEDENNLRPEREEIMARFGLDIGPTPSRV